MTERLKLFILAGEASGDRLAADLVAELARLRNVELAGVGGAELASQGLTSMFPMEELSVMGWADVLPRLPLLLWRARQVAQAIVRTSPDVVVLVDAQVFSAVVARAVRRRGARTRMILYVAPAVWAWKPERAAALNGLFDEVMAVLPFEPAVMAKLGGPPTTYVGHPAAARFQSRPAQPDTGPLMLLPGSREGELRRHLPIMRSVAERFARHERVAGFVLPTPAVHRQRLKAETATWPVPVEIVSGEAAKHRAFGEAIAAVAVTGTVTLELGLAGVPMVTTYVGDRGQAKRWARYAAKFASLPNILLNRPLVPEIIGLEPDAGAVGDALAELLAVGGLTEQLDGFDDMRRLMEQGAPDAPPVEPAVRVLARAGISGS